MDKNTKLPQASTKGVPADSKKNQDVTNNKLFPKTSRKQESAGTNNFLKHEQPRKYNVPKTKNFDKRSKSKGQYYGCPKENTKVGNTEPAESGSAMAQGSKKQNLNHLLNFHYESHDAQGSLSMWNQRKWQKGYNRNSNRWLPPVQRHKYNKEQFLQASCQFVVSTNGNYSLHLADPDVLVDWKLVEQIKIQSSDSLSCPICLCPPVAGKMTRCGHVYCCPCILHYLSLSDKSWRKCPICYESVHKSDLRSVVEITQSTFNSGDMLTLRLMRREKGSLLAVPVGSTIQNPTNFFSVSENVSKQVYSKLLIASLQDIADIIECERVQLKMELMKSPDSPENCYIEQALNELSKREEELFQKTESNSTEPIISASISEATGMQVNSKKKQQTSRQQVDPKQMAHTSSLPEKFTDGKDNSSTNIQSNPGAQKVFYFYQADDGQHLYLHAMNVKMLEMQYGSLENSPHVITGKLLEKESGSLTDDLRRRLRYLCHLPLTCQFEIAEIELKPPIVSSEVLTEFHDQIALRQKCRQRREREERKREKKITEEEDKRMGKYPTPEVHIDSQLHFPEWQPETLFAVENIQESPMLSSFASSPPLSTFEEVVTNRPTEVNQEHGPSFAEMLRNKGLTSKSTKAWPSLTNSKPQSNSPVRCASSDSDNESYSMPSYSPSFGDALAHALKQSQLLDTGAKKTTGTSSGKKKKKKYKSPMLFGNMTNPL